MRGNQFRSSNASKNLNLRLPPELRTRVEAAAAKADPPKTKADVVREALELYLPILEAQKEPEP